jgi:phosphoesterase RecJ-like protein
MMKKIDEVLEGKKTIGITGHVRPDGDCVGSTLAMYNYISDRCPEAQIRLFLEPMPNIFGFLKGVEQVCHDYPDEPSFDLFIVLDCGDIGRIGDAAKYFNSAAHTVCIDHHISNQAFAEVNYVFPDASSTCELVFELLEEEAITKAIAECLYTGIVHDTGVFQYSCTASKTMNIAGKLMDKGIDYNRIVDETFHQKTYNQNRVMGKALLDSQLYLDGRVIVAALPLATMKEFDVLPKHMDGIVNQLRVTKGVRVAVFLYENEDHSYKASFRVNGDFDAAALAMHFGGGGHVKAAGCTLEGELAEIIDRIVSEIQKRL